MPRCLGSALAVGVALLTAMAGGCGSDHAMTLLDSDVSAPPEMDVRYAFDIARIDGQLAGGRFILAGTVDDINAVAEETMSRYASSGWTLREQRMLPAEAKLVFEKGTRTATVEIARRRVDPEMSSAVIVVSNAG